MVVCNPLLQADCEGPYPHLLRRLLRHTDIGYPGLVRAHRHKRLIEHIVSNRERMVRIGGRLELPLLLAAQAQLFPQTRNPVASGLKTLGRQLRLDAQRPIGLASLHMHGFDCDLEPLIFLAAQRRGAAQPCIEPAARDAGDAAKQAQWVVESHRFYERVARSARTLASLATWSTNFAKSAPIVLIFISGTHFGMWLSDIPTLAADYVGFEHAASRLKCATSTVGFPASPGRAD